MNVEQLRALWRKTHGQPPPEGLSKDLIARALSYQIQEAALGGLSPEALRTLLVRTPYHHSTRLAMTRGFKCQAAEWLANPGRLDEFHNSLKYLWAKLVGTWYFARETAGQPNEKCLNVYLTDGGHIENLGIYELLRRRCRVIIAVDAEADQEMTSVIGRTSGSGAYRPWNTYRPSVAGSAGACIGCDGEETLWTAGLARRYGSTHSYRQNRLWGERDGRTHLHQVIAERG